VDIEGKRIWQVAAGDTNRSYAHLLLEWDVIVDGPGYRGPWPACEKLLREEGWKRKVADLRRFCEEIKKGDLVVLRVGTADVYGVGEVVDDGPQWLADFGDVDGWDLQHVRRVRWLCKYAEQPKHFAAYALKWGDTVQLMESESVAKWLRDEVQVPDEALQRPLTPLPRTGDEVQPEEVPVDRIGEYLFDRGMAASSIDTLVHQMDDLTRIAKWYRRAGLPVSEHETIAYLVVPLLRALGWTPQRMAVEWHGPDLALFTRPTRQDRDLAVAVEVKKLDTSCLTAKSQAEDYAERSGREGCRRLIVTDGLRYGVYLREAEGKFPDQPQAYLNLARLMDAYPILDCLGAKEALWTMSPDWVEAAEGAPKGVLTADQEQV